jgi:hypothetical protein
MELDSDIHIVMHSVLSLKPGVTQKVPPFQQSREVRVSLFYRLPTEGYTRGGEF